MGSDPALLGKLLQAHRPLARDSVPFRKQHAHGLLEQVKELDPLVDGEGYVVVLEHDREVELARAQTRASLPASRPREPHFRRGRRRPKLFSASGRMVAAAVVIEPTRSDAFLPARRRTSASASARRSRMSFGVLDELPPRLRQGHARGPRRTSAEPRSPAPASATCCETAEGVNERASAAPAIDPRMATSRSTRMRRTSSISTA